MRVAVLGRVIMLRQNAQRKTWMKKAPRGGKAQPSQLVLARLVLGIPPPPGFDIMKSIEEPTPPSEGTSGSHQNQVPSTATAMPNTFNTKTASSGIPAPHPPKKVEIGSFVYLNRQHNYFHLAFLFLTLFFSFQFCEHNSISL